MARQRKKRSQSSWFDQVERAPRPESTDVQKMRRSVKKWRAAVWVVMSLSVLLLASTAALLADGGTPDAASVHLEATSPGQPEARLAVRNWLDSESSALPGGIVVSWDGAQLTPWPDTDDDIPDYSLYLHQFTVTGANLANLYEVQVRAAVSVTGGVNIVGQPSLIPIAKPVRLPSNTLVWPGFVASSTSPSITDAVGQWVRAYTSGDPTELRLSVGDEDGERGYVPLSGIVDATADISNVAQPAENVGTDNDGTTVIAAVTVTMSRTGLVADTESPSSFDLDVLILGANTASPRVVAWGGPGSGVLLEPYRNAVMEDRAENLPDTSGEITPTVTPSPSTSPQPHADVTDSGEGM